MIPFFIIKVLTLAYILIYAKRREEYEKNNMCGFGFSFVNIHNTT